MISAVPLDILLTVISEAGGSSAQESTYSHVHVICVHVRRETLLVMVSGVVSAPEFAALSAALAGAPAAPVRHAALLQYGRAAAAAAQGAPAAAHWELLQREERQLALAATEGTSGNALPRFVEPMAEHW